MEGDNYQNEMTMIDINIKKQDVMLDNISKSLESIKDIGINIQGELNVQMNVLNVLDKNINITDDNLQKANENIIAIKKKKTHKYLYIIICFLLLILIAVILISVLSRFF